MRNKDLSEAKRVSHSKDQRWVQLWGNLTVVIQVKGFGKSSKTKRLGKQKFEDLKNLKCCLEL